MVRILMEHHFPQITPRGMFMLLMDPTFDVALGPVLGVARREVLERREDAEAIYRRVRMVPGMPIPALVRRALGQEEFEYVEDARVDKKTWVMTWTVRPNYFTDRVRAQGTVTARAEGAGASRVIDGEVTVDVPGIGGIIERAVKDAVTRSYGKSADFMRDWISSGRLNAVKGMEAEG